MKTTKLITLIAAGLLIAAQASARTDVKGALTQLKTNEDNAKANKKQYDDNAEIASKNIVEVTAAIKALREQKAGLAGNAQNLQKNLAVLDKMKERLQTFSAEEQAAMKKEDQQINQLKAALEKLEANKLKREQNVEAYSQKITEVENEKQDWAAQKEAFASIQKELDTKETKALAEREKWIEKRKGYRTEGAKWDKEAQVAEQQRVKYSKLQN